MTHKPVVSNHKDANNREAYAIGIILSATSIFVFLYFAFLGKYVNGGLLAMALMMTAITIGFIQYYSSIKQLVIDTYDLQLIYPNAKRNKSIPLSSIASWTEVHKKEKSAAWDVLRLYSTSGTTIISSKYFDHYSAVKGRLTKGLHRDKIREQKIDAQDNLMLGLLLLAVGGFFLWLTMLPNDPPVSARDTVAVSGVITNQPRVERSKSARWINIDLSPYPEEGIHLGGAETDVAQKSGFLDEVKQGDTITVYIHKTDYQKTITKELKPSFYERTFGFGRLNALALQARSKTYFTPEQINQMQQARTAGDVWSKVGIGAFFLLLSLMFLFWWYRQHFNMAQADSGFQDYQ